MSIFHRLLHAFTAEDVSQAPAVAKDSHIDEALAHAKEGYKNAQDVIKFVDTKTAVVTGLSTVIGGALVGVLKWAIESEKDTHATITELALYHPCAAGWFYFFVTTCFAAMFVCIAAAVWSVIARARPRHLENKFTVLFPYYKQRDETAACQVISGKLAGMSKGQILLEYEDQLRVVGMILGKKLKHIRVACFALLVELLLFVLAVILLAFMYVWTPDALCGHGSMAELSRTIPGKGNGVVSRHLTFDSQTSHRNFANLGRYKFTLLPMSVISRSRPDAEASESKPIPIAT
jgi:hypothetical protein